MRIPRVFVDQPLQVGAVTALPTAAAHYLLRVLRLKPGDPVLLFDGRGGEYRSVLDASAHDACVRIEQYDPVERESTLRVTLAQGISRGDRMDYTIQKAVELGVDSIVPVEAGRSVVRLPDARAEKRLRRWRDIARAAAAQCGRNRVPRIEPARTLGAWLRDIAADPAAKLLLHPQAGMGITQLPAPDAGVCLLVGPEGGLSDAELDTARTAGFSAVHLGPRVLRTETAGVACLAILQALWGDI